MRLQCILIWTVLLTSTARCTDSVTTCSITTPSVHEEVILVCRFPEPISQIRNDISVQRNEFNHASASAPSVLECPLSRRQDHNACVAGEGYIFKGFSSNSNEVEIYLKNVSKEHEGSYTCQLVGHSSTIISCNFTLSMIPPKDQGIDVETSKSSVSITSPTNGTEVSNLEVNNIQFSVGAIAGIAAGCIAILAVVCVSVWCVSKKCFQRKSKGVPTSQCRRDPESPSSSTLVSRSSPDSEASALNPESNIASRSTMEQHIPKLGKHQATQRPILNEELDASEPGTDQDASGTCTEQNLPGSCQQRVQNISAEADEREHLDITRTKRGKSQSDEKKDDVWSNAKNKVSCSSPQLDTFKLSGKLGSPPLTEESGAYTPSAEQRASEPHKSSHVPESSDEPLASGYTSTEQTQEKLILSEVPQQTSTPKTDQDAKCSRIEPDQKGTESTPPAVDTAVENVKDIRFTDLEQMPEISQDQHQYTPVTVQPIIKKFENMKRESQDSGALAPQDSTGSEPIIENQNVKKSFFHWGIQSGSYQPLIKADKNKTITESKSDQHIDDDTEMSPLLDEKEEQNKAILQANPFLNKHKDNEEKQTDD